MFLLFAFSGLLRLKHDFAICTLILFPDDTRIQDWIIIIMVLRRTETAINVISFDVVIRYRCIDNSEFDMG